MIPVCPLSDCKSKSPSKSCFENDSLVGRGSEDMSSMPSVGGSKGSKVLEQKRFIKHSGLGVCGVSVEFVLSM